MRTIADDPEQSRVLDELARQRESLDRRTAERVHLLPLPMEDVDDNGAIVNALQRQATVVVQKSFAEGFGLTVTEARQRVPLSEGEDSISSSRTTQTCARC